ncbi:barren [Metschnikowia bicuspidata]|uniref:Condensin complex subunit 2 n=1 Tax=Metschnikowia bicuspidata TaxID=27322 RepID=A0A4P9Z990_9ASCO|nr:barren [Metschnikowia bicuspidata]
MGRQISGRVASSSKRKQSGARRVSRGEMFVARNDDVANSSFGEDAIHFHENKSTIMSNFEEWIKLSTDNKITLKNSWLFALIDYFHDLNVIKDGENINFQRASATLDGCVKIYLSRVESAASETGKLLSGLATKKGQLELEMGSDDEDAEKESGDGVETEKRKERRINRIVESTLVPFESIQIQKLDQELAIDPLFKKALADFDEGGAKSLLLNALNIDSTGRVVFDATTNSTASGSSKDKEDTALPNEPTPMVVDECEVDISKIQTLLFGTETDLSSFTLCPSIKELKEVLNDVNKAKSVLSDVNNRFLTDSQAEREPAATEPAGGDLGDDLDLDLSVNMGPDLDFDADQNEGMPLDVSGADINDCMQEAGGNGPISEALDIANLSLEETGSNEKVLDQDLMAYFDDKMKTNWHGPEHWRIQKLKQSKKLDQPKATTPQPEGPKRKKKELVFIDFFAEDDDPDFIEDMFVKPRNPALITKKPEVRKSSALHLLPSDIQYNSQRLVNLFIKPSKTIATFRRKNKFASESEDGEANRTYTDERFFAEKYVELEREKEEETRQDKLAVSFQMAEMDDYDNYGGIDFNDALGDASVSVREEEDKKEESSQLMAKKVRPGYVNFSRVAKRVDVKLLKDNLWKTIKNEEKDESRPEAAPENALVVRKNFTEVVGSIGRLYRPDEEKDLSTSFCFICLLHLANEHGLSIEANALHDDLLITGF